MAASGFTPISLYYSTTAAAAPTAGNLVDGELAINITDGKLYYKDNAGVVKLLASSAGPVNIPVTVPQGGTGLTTLATGRIPYGNGTGAYQSSAALSFTGTALVLGTGGALGGLTNPFLEITGNTNNFIQGYIFNANSGTSASADFVAYGDAGSDTGGFIDMGCGSTNYADAAYTVTGPSEGYILMSAPSSGASKSGNLVYATDSTGTTNSHQWYIGGFTQAKSAWKMQLTSTGLELATPLAVASGGTGASSLPAGGLVGVTATQTLTNKRITPRIGTTTSSATITPTADASDQYNVTALATTATFAIPSGTPTNGQKLSIRILAPTTQTISWTTTAGGYRVIGTTLPLSAPAGKTIYVGCVYNSADSFWDVVAVATEA